MKPAAGQSIKAARSPAARIEPLEPPNAKRSPGGLLIVLLFDWIATRLQMRNQLVKISKRSFFAQVASNGVMANLNNKWQNGGTAPWQSGGFFTSIRSVPLSNFIAGAIQHVPVWAMGGGRCNSRQSQAWDKLGRPQTSHRFSSKPRKGYWVIFAFWVSLTLNCCSGDQTNAPNDAVAFFKKAINSEPDVERYSVSQFVAERKETSYYVGARSGSNYFLQTLSNSNELQDLSQKRLIVGRSGDDAYEFTGNAITYGNGKNPATANVLALQALTRQFLDMGVSEISAGSVTWKNDKFTAADDHGNPSYGELQISNGLPSRLEISNFKGPYKVVKYVYPDPPNFFDGFPSKMAIFAETEGKLNCEVEVVFNSVQLAAKPLAADYFSETQFITPAIIHTNIYSNTVLYVQNHGGQMVKAPDSIIKSGGTTNSHSRTVVFLCLGLTAVVPIVLFIYFRKIKN